MPRSTVSFQPVDPNTPISNGLSNALASIVQGFQQRRLLDAETQERNFQHGRQLSNDQLRLEEILSQRRNRDQQLALAQAGLQDRRDQRALDDERLNEQTDFHNRELAQKEILAANLLDERKAAVDERAGRGKGGLAFKDARRLAIAQARGEAGRDAFGNPKAIDPRRVDELTQQFMDSGNPSDPVQPTPKTPPELAPLDDNVLAPPAQPTASAPPAAAPAPASGPSLLDRYIDASSDGLDAIASMFRSDDSAPASAPGSANVPQMTPGYMDPFGLQYRIKQNQQPTAPPASAPPADAAAPPEATPAPAAAPAAASQPDPAHLDSLEALAVGNPPSFVKVMKELKARSPAEYTAVDGALRARRQKKAVLNAAP